MFHTESLITGGHSPLEVLLRDRRLYSVFQPIVNLSDASVYSHEALIRGPEGTSMHSPDVLLREAAAEGLAFAFESECLRAALSAWGKASDSGRLFLNISADALIANYAHRGTSVIQELITSFGIQPRMLTLEITEHERVSDMNLLADVVGRARSMGIALALDDFGDGRSSLRLWSELKPEIVKIDKYFTKDISNHVDKVKTIQALQQIASVLGSELVAEGIENGDDLRVLRDLGIHYGQGYFLGRPSREIARIPMPSSRQVLLDRRVAVLPELSRAAQSGMVRRMEMFEAPYATRQTNNDELAQMFLANPTLHAMALLEDLRPVGIINRAKFMNEYTKLYYREVWGRKSCDVHANKEPRVIERNYKVDELVGILTSQDQRYLNDGFIVTENGRYAGLGTGDQLVRSVTEMRIEAARHANPLTFLPGNIPLNQHIERLLRMQVQFVACYADLNDFKPFNDRYGYWRGDEMIRLLAHIAMEQCDQQRDFLGHVGGDDFIILFQSLDWRARCERLIQRFNREALALFDDAARAAGGIHAEDRHGVERFFPCTSVCIGAICIDGSHFERAEDVAHLAAKAKHAAKHGSESLVEIPAM